MFSKHTNCGSITYVFDGLLKVLSQVVFCSVMDKGVCSSQHSTLHTHKYLHATCLSSASLLLSTLSVWGWLVHDTLLKIDIRSLCKRRLTKEWEEMNVHEGVRECDKDRKRQRVGERKKGREEDTKSTSAPKLYSKKTNTHICVGLKWSQRKKMNIWDEGNEAVLQEMGTGAGSRDVGSTDDRHKATNCHTILYLMEK